MKTIKKSTSVQISLEHSPQAIFNIISDHEGTPDWVAEVAEVKLLKSGTPRNGKGAIREVNFRPKFWSTVQEEIIDFQENKEYSYHIIEGMPGLVNHRGNWSLKGTDSGETLVTWAVDFEFKRWHWFSLLLGNFMTSFHQVQKEALEGLKKQLG